MKAIDHFNEKCDFTGKTILEIGGSPPFDSAQELVARGAKKVVCIDCRPNFKDQRIAENIVFRNMDARKLKFRRNTFDLVFGVAVLEHLNNLDTVLSELHRVLVKGGYAYLHGGPIWSCNLGHHIYMVIDKVQYFFNQSNPIPNWHHLILGKEEMRTFLEERHIPGAHAEKIVEMIYDNSMLNRYFFEDYIRFLEKSRFRICEFHETVWGNPSQDIEEKIAMRLPPPPRMNGIASFFSRRKRNSDNETKRNYRTGAIVAILQKEIKSGESREKTFLKLQSG